MLIRFESKAGRFTMFGDIAVYFLKMMGHSGTVPSAILAADLPAAIERLEKALGNPPPLPEEPKEARDKTEAAEGEDEPRVSISQRVFPLLELLKAAARRKADVMWEQEESAKFVRF